MSIREALTGAILLTAMGISVSVLMADRQAASAQSGQDVVTPASATGGSTLPGDSIGNGPVYTTSQSLVPSPCGSH